NSLTAFDYDTHLLTDYIPLRLPSGLKLSRDEASLFVSEAFGLYVLNTDHEVIYTVPTEAEGRVELSPDEAFAYVAERRTNVLRVIDLAAREVVDTLTVGSVPVDIGVTPDGKRLYVLNLDSRDIAVVDLERRQVVDRIDFGSVPQEIAITADGRRAYVTDSFRGVISVLNLETNKVVGGIQVDGENTNGLAFSPDGEALYVSSDGWLLDLDVKRNLVRRSLELADETSIVGISPDGARAYVGTFQRQGGGPGLAAVDLDGWRILGRMRGISFPVEIQFRRIPKD
ncbi:MAG: beta-propeller fold lactonase family protein, partial [Candidatus Latescibacteria bacterium]|nr:beta-propeller fold lactonase family protein [Candidatus Latescibacterota bacterium]